MPQRRRLLPLEFLLSGSTGLPYFRPPGVKQEAARLIVRNNTIEGSLCAAAFVGVDGAEVVGNTVGYPGKWIFRILTATHQPGFAPCRNVLIQDNRIKSGLSLNGSDAEDTRQACP